jgi:hypothetical protein
VTVAAVVALGVGAGVASAVPPTTVIIDENGHGSLSDGTILQWMIGQDTGPGGLPNALIYSLPFPLPLVAGDVILEEPIGNLSDVVRFNPDGTIVFYSDNSEGGAAAPDELADVGFPTQFWTNSIYMPEIGPEGNNGASYSPGPGMPGFSDQMPLNYQFISDVPEPATLVLLGLGGLATLIRRKAR